MLNSKATRKSGSRRKAQATKTKTVTVVRAPVVVQRSKRRSRRKATNVRFMGKIRSSIARLSDCADKYLTAIADPWHSRAFGACVPVPTGPTMKAHGFVRTTLQISNTGAGSGHAWIIVAPSPANNAQQIFHSTSSYSRDDVNPFSNGALLPGGQVNALDVPNLPFATASMIPAVDGKPAVAARVVSAGLRARFVGRAVDVGGLAYAIREPYHASVQVAPNVANFSTDVTTLGQRPQVVIRNLDREWISVTDFASSRAEMEMESYVETKNDSPNVATSQTKLVYPFSKGEADYYDEILSAATQYGFAGVNVGIPTMMIFFRGEPGQTIEWEYRIHCEYNGPPASSLALHNASDPVGAERVQSAAQEVSQQGRMASEPAQTHSLITDAIGELQAALQENVVQPLARAAVSAGAAAVGGLILQAQQRRIEL
jgi:hypothetical protein